MVVCTPAEVYTFMGTPSDQQTTARGNAITDLISRATEQFKRHTGRSPELIDCTTNSKAFTADVNCKLFGHELFLDNEYRDFYEITEVKENGLTLNEIVSSATQNYDYLLDAVCGKLIRPWGSWLRIPACIEIKGRFGLITRAGTVGNYTYPTRDDVKQIIIEMVAALTGIWRQTIVTESGSLETTRLKISESTQRALDGFVLRPL